MVSVEVCKKKIYVKCSFDEIEVECQCEFEEQCVVEEVECLKVEEVVVCQCVEEEVCKVEEVVCVKVVQEVVVIVGVEFVVVVDVVVVELVVKFVVVEECKKEELCCVFKCDEDDDCCDCKYIQYCFLVKEKEKVFVLCVVLCSIDEESDGYCCGGCGGKLKLKKCNQYGFQNLIGLIVCEVNIGEIIIVVELVVQMLVKGVEVVKFMFKMGFLVIINQVLDQEIV